MRYDREHKERTRKRVLSEAASAILAGGPEAISVASLMSKVGLTHGGFYAHFRSKDELVAETITCVFDTAYETLKERAERVDATECMSQFVDGYLCMSHRDGPETGCPVPSLMGDLPRLSVEARRSFAEGLERLARAVGGPLRKLGVPHPIQAGRAIISQMAGAVALARALRDTPASDQILRDTRRDVRARLNLH